jgi:hypothetical protein
MGVIMSRYFPSIYRDECSAKFLDAIENDEGVFVEEA